METAAASNIPFCEEAAGNIDQQVDDSPKPSSSQLVVAALLNVLFAGLIQQGPLLQPKLVDERGLTWPEADFVFVTAFTILTLGFLFIAAAGASARTGMIVGLFVESLGLFAMCFSSSPWTLAASFGAGSLGGLFIYVSTLQLCSAAGSPFASAMMATAYNSSAYLGYVFSIPELSLNTVLAVESSVAFAAALMVLAFFRPPVGPSTSSCDPRALTQATELRNPRYMFFCAAFAISTVALIVGSASYDAAAEKVLSGGDAKPGSSNNWLINTFSFTFNATFLTLPLLSIWVEKGQWLVPIFAQLVSLHIFLCCLAWPSRTSLIIAMPFGSIAQACVYMHQGAYLTSFPKEQFTPLLTGTVVFQAAVQLTSNILPTDGAAGAKLWAVMVCIGYAWPFFHLRHTRLQAVSDTASSYAASAAVS